MKGKLDFSLSNNLSYSIFLKKTGYYLLKREDLSSLSLWPRWIQINLIIKARKETQNKTLLLLQGLSWHKSVPKGPNLDSISLKYCFIFLQHVMTLFLFSLSYLEDYHMSCLPLVLKFFTLGLLSLLEAVEGGRKSWNPFILQQRLLEKSSP